MSNIVEFDVGAISDIKWNGSAWDDLILPKDQKDVLLALIEARKIGAGGPPPADVIEGKGQGLNVLL